MIVPLVANSASAQLNVSDPLADELPIATATDGDGFAAPRRTVTVSPVASVICEAMVRFQMSS